MMYTITQNMPVDVRHMVINIQCINSIYFNINYKVETIFFLEFFSDNLFLEARKVKSKCNNVESKCINLHDRIAFCKLRKFFIVNHPRGVCFISSRK